MNLENFYEEKSILIHLQAHSCLSNTWYNMYEMFKYLEIEKSSYTSALLVISVSAKHSNQCTLLPRLRALRPYAGQLQILQFFGKQDRQKRAHAPFFLALIFRYKTDIFQNKKKLHIDLKKKK